MRAVILIVLGLCAGCVVQPAPSPLVAVPAAPAAPQPAGSNCREFDTPVVIDGQEQLAHGFACLQPDGSWRVQQEIAGQPPTAYLLPPQAYGPYYPPAYVADPWYYGPPLFAGRVFIGGGWGFRHHHAGWHGAWRGGHLHR